MISDTGVRRILIENANSEHKRAIRPWKSRSAPTEEWIKKQLIIDLTLVVILG